MTKFTKDIELKFSIDKKEAERTKKEVEKIGKIDVKGIAKDVGSSIWSFGKTFLNGLTSELFDVNFSLKGILDGAINLLNDSFKNALEEMNNVLGSSYLSNSTTRENAFKYGFDMAQSYAFEKTKSFMGINGDEDMMYMTSEQWDMFTDKFDDYTNKYDRLYDSGFFKNIQEYQWEMADFKEQMTYEFMDWFVANKDLIKLGMQALMRLATDALELLGWIGGLLGGSRSNVPVSTVNNQKSVNVNIKQDNSFNGTPATQQADFASVMAKTIEELVAEMR